MTSLDHELQDIARAVFDADDLLLHDSTVAGDVPGWDSLGHINFIFSIEEAFEVSFTDDEFANVDDVGSLKRLLVQKLAARGSSVQPITADSTEQDYPG